MRNTLHLYGPPCAGKGRIAKLLAKEYGHRIVVIGTGAMIRDAAKDPNFAREHAHNLRNRIDLPSNVIYRMIEAKMYSAEHPQALLVFDGFRTASQRNWAKARDLFAIGHSVTILLEASESTCQYRATHRRTTQPDGVRTNDEPEIITRGYKRHYEGLPGLRNWLNNSHELTFMIDANRDLETQVYPQVLEAIAPFMIGLKKQQPAVPAQAPFGYSAPQVQLPAARQHAFR